MGSYCITCSASGQVIAEGDPCVAVPIIQQSTFNPVELMLDDQPYSLYGVANTTCYPGSHWAPKGAFVTGTYADYGYIDPEDTPTNRRAMAELFRTLWKNAPIVKEGKNPSHEIPFDLKTFAGIAAPTLAERISASRTYDNVNIDGVPFPELQRTWEYVWGVANEHRLFCRDGSMRIRPLQFAAFHRVTFDHLVAFTNKQVGWDNTSFALDAFLLRQIAELTEEEAAPNGKSQAFFMREAFIERLKLGMSDSVGNALLPFREDVYRLLTARMDTGLSQAEFLADMTPIMAGVYSIAAMNQLNLRFNPIIYAGQDYDNRQGKAIAKFISGVSREVTKARKDRGD